MDRYKLAAFQLQPKYQANYQEIPLKENNYQHEKEEW